MDDSGRMSDHDKREYDRHMSTCMCGCHVIDDPSNHGQKCDFCNCIAGFGKQQRPPQQEQYEEP